MSFNLDGYVPVAERIVKWYERHPDGRIVADPPVFVEGGWLVTARAYQSPDDTQPSQGSAWEPTPGKTSFTRDSEPQNAETAAVGRALALAGIEVHRGMASAEEVRNRAPEGGPSCSVCEKPLAGQKAVKVGNEYRHEGCA